MKLSELDLRSKYQLGTDSRDWTVNTAKLDITANQGKDLFKQVSYRPFDERITYYTGNSRGFYASPQRKIMHHLNKVDNYAFCSCKANRDFSHTYWIAKSIVSKSVISSLDNSYVFPLYLYPETNNQITTDQTKRTPNLNVAIVQQIAENIGISFVPEKEREGNVCLANSQDVRPEFRQTFAPIDLLDYIYAVLHSPTYRETYKEFLKIDFPRVPYPKDAAMFWALVGLGSQLRQVHLLESPAVENYVTQYPADGDNVVRKIKYEAGNVYINETQYFAKVPPVAWAFYIGGYQPAQKWLKDRKGRELGFEDILHYQKIIVALVETDRLMQEIDKIGTL